jgi:uncharacterized protein YydD (DUF2326 family)
MTGGFNLPFKQTSEQRLWDQQVAISYLLGLDWTIPQQLEHVRDQERGLRELRKAADTGILGDLVPSTADLRTKLAVRERQAQSVRKQIESFKVIVEYHDLEQEAAILTQRLNELADSNTVDRQLIAEMEQTFQEEMPPSLTELEQVYKDVGVKLPKVAMRRFADVRNFHDSVVKNRRVYITQEIEAAQNRLNDRHRVQERLDRRRSKIITILRSSGALEQRDLLRSELSRLEGEVELLRQQFYSAEKMETKKAELAVERAKLHSRLRQDYSEQHEVLNEAIVTFEGISKALYESPGSFVVSPESNGPVFEVRIQGSRSKGITNMQIFCFDLTLSKLCAERNLGPGFLIHDSHLFDGVDERQIAAAFEVGAKTSEEYGFQYIVTMNSDMIPDKLRNSAMLNKAILPVRLTDSREDGGLFGIRFG